MVPFEQNSEAPITVNGGSLYFWSIIGQLNTPPTNISRSRFVGHIKEYPGDFPPVAVIPTTVLYPCAWNTEFSICKATVYTFKGLAIYDKNNVLAAHACLHYTYVFEKFRYNRLGSEILAELYVTYPELLSKRAERMITRQYTPTGLKAINNAYSLLTERKAVEYKE